MTNEQRDVWTEEALEALKALPEANPSIQTTETAAWRAGFVRGYLAARIADFESGENDRERD